MKTNSPKFLLLARAFSRDESGQIALLFMVLILPMLVLSGGALDYAVMLLQKQKDQAAIDAAVLAAAKMKIKLADASTQDQRRDLRKQMFSRVLKANYPGDFSKANYKLTFADREIRVVLKNKTENNFLKIIGLDDIKYKVRTASLYKPPRNFELILVFDSTGSMHGVIENIKNKALTFTDDILARLNDEGVSIDQIQTQIIDYKDFWVDQNPMNISPFFNLPSENIKFRNRISNIVVGGGGDYAESALEAIVLARRSKSDERLEKRHAKKLIVLWTDIEAIPLRGNRERHLRDMIYPSRKSGTPRSYPANMPLNLAKMHQLWKKAPNVRLLLFTPTKYFYPWYRIERWDRVDLVEGDPNNLDYSLIINRIVRQMSNFSEPRLTQ